MRNSKGFTLLEMMIVVAIVGVIAVVVVPQFVSSTNLAEMRAATRKLKSSVSRVKTLAQTGKNEGYAGWIAADRTVEAGIEIDPNGYHLFVDRNSLADGDEAVLEIVDFSAGATANSAPNLSIVAPAVGTQIRFQKKGTLVGGANQSITIQDVSGAQMTVLISFGGGTEVQ